MLRAGNVLVASLVLVQTACFVETSPNRRREQPGVATPATPAANLPLADDVPGTCRQSDDRGCFDGYLAVKKPFLVEGHAFFNADDLATRFAELVLPRAIDGAPAPAALRVSLTTPLDNASFGQGFEYLLTGAIVRSGRVRTDGTFAVNDLPDGSYELRIMRPVAFSLGGSVPPPHATAADSHPPAPAPVQRCATLYADQTVDIRHGQRSYENFSDFRLHLADGPCSQGGGRS